MAGQVGGVGLPGGRGEDDPQLWAEALMSSRPAGLIVSLVPVVGWRNCRGWGLREGPGLRPDNRRPEGS